MLREDNNIKAIIVAGGLGSRLNPLTNNQPKCMLKVGGKTIIRREIDVLRKCGIGDVVVVTGYKKEKISYPDIKYYHDDNYRTPGILRGLFCAEKEMEDSFIFSYSDIIYTEDVVKKLLSGQNDINLIIDVDWMKQYENRVKHPVAEAELVQVEDNKIVRIGKNMDPENAYGEFIGLAMFSKKGVEIFKREFQKAKSKYYNKPFQNSETFEKAYLTDMMQELINEGHLISNVDIQGNWMEIDTEEDLKKAKTNCKDLNYKIS